MNRYTQDLFTRAEWWIFRITGIVMLLVLAFKLLRAEFTGLF